MKKMLVCLFVLLLVPLYALAGDVTDGVKNLPPEIASYLAGSDRWKDYTVTGWANPAGQEDGFAALLKGDDTELTCFRLQEGAWKYVWHNDEALPDNGQPFILADATGSLSLHSQTAFEQPTLLSYYVLNGELCEFSCIWEKQSGTWLLRSYSMFEPEEISAEVWANRVDFYFSDAQDTPDAVQGVLERSLRYINADALPRSLAQAQRKLSLPPEIPVGELEAERVQFTGGRKYKVYQGPGEDYGQAGGGKAVVSTNDWIQLFGRMDEWLLIQYDITSDRMRIGWISADALPAGVQAEELSFSAQQATVTVDGACVTDDPLFSQTATALLPAGTTVTRLSSMGDWSYIRVYSYTAPQYGFIKTASLQLETLQDRARRQGSNALTEVYGYSQAEVDACFVFSGSISGNELTVTMHPAAQPGWVYESVFRVDTGKHVRSFTPFATDYELYQGEGTFRYTLDTALEQGWLYNWTAEDRAALQEWMLRWEMPATSKLTQGLQDGSITCLEAVTELFLSNYGPQEHWPQPLREWHDQVLKNVKENFPANG